MSAADDRYNHSAKGRTRWLRYYDKRMQEPTFYFSEQERKWRYYIDVARPRTLLAQRAALNAKLEELEQLNAQLYEGLE